MGHRRVSPRSKTTTYFVALGNSTIINAGISRTSICARNFLALQLTVNGGFLPWHGFGEVQNQYGINRWRRGPCWSVFFEVREVLSQMIERLRKIWRRQGSASMVLAGSAPLGGCARVGFEQTKTPVMVSGVILMSKEGVPAETIVKIVRLEICLSSDSSAVSLLARSRCRRSCH
jgi:hypothetical protein